MIEIRQGDRTASVLCEGGSTVVLPILTATHLGKGDVRSHSLRMAASSSAGPEILIRKPHLKRSNVYQGRTGYATHSKPDRRGELLVRADVIGSRFGITAISNTLTNSKSTPKLSAFRKRGFR